MKKRSKKVQNKILLMSLYKMHPTSMDDQAVELLVEAIGDEDLEDLIKAYVKAQKELDEYMEKMKQDLAAYLPDDSDF